MCFFCLFRDLVNDTLTGVEKKYGQGWTAMGMFIILVSIQTAWLVILAGASWVWLAWKEVRDA